MAVHPDEMIWNQLVFLYVTVIDEVQQKEKKNIVQEEKQQKRG